MVSEETKESSAAAKDGSASTPAADGASTTKTAGAADKSKSEPAGTGQAREVPAGSVGVVDNAPHPNAAAVYLNWLLSKEGQIAWTKVPRVSRRLDVPSPDPTMAPKPGIQYFNGQAEKYFPVRARLQLVAQQTIGQPMPEQRDPDAE